MVANLDMFEPTEEIIHNADFNWDFYNWDIYGNNLYDAKIKQLQERQKTLVVQNVQINSCGDLAIQFCQDIVLEVFMNASFDECWRFFQQQSSEPHLVMTGQGVATY